MQQSENVLDSLRNGDWKDDNNNNNNNEDNNNNNNNNKIEDNNNNNNNLKDFSVECTPAYSV